MIIELQAKVLMASGSTLLLLQWFVVDVVAASGCMMVEHFQKFNGMTCQPFYHKDIHNVPYHQCSLTCLQSHRCETFIYDERNQSCVMMDTTCVWPRPHEGHIYVISKPPCFKWEPHSSDYPFYWFWESSIYKCYIARQPHQDNMLVGKSTSTFYTIDPNNSEVLRGGSHEKLVVESSCQVTWVPHDTNSGKPLPSDALIGGVLSDTNTPLYVVRQQASGKLFTSFYNPLNKQAWGELGGAAITSTQFEVMVIKRMR